MQENKEIEIRYEFIATPEFAKTFFDNAVVTEVSYIVPPKNSGSTTYCRFRRRNDKATMACKTSDGKNTDSIEQYEDEIEISNEAFEAYTKKLTVTKFFYYEDSLGRKFKSFSDEQCFNPKIVVEKEFDHIPDKKEINDFIISILTLGHDVYDRTDDYTLDTINKYNECLKKNN